METYLTVDIGNSAVSIAVVKGLRVRYAENVDVNQPVRDFTGAMKKVLATVRRGNYDLTAVLVCSVVPVKNRPVRNLLTKHLGIRPHFVGEDLDVPLINKYRDPAQVGRDRLVGAYAAQQLFGQPAVIVDFGTAITLDVLSRDGHYMGGVIVPGMRLSLESLHRKAALLPRIEEVHRPRSVIGRTTEHSILSGLVYGYGEMCRGLVRRISRNIEGRPRIVVTGGYARLMVQFLSDLEPAVDTHLVHKGLVLCYRHHIRG
ncbi:MAG: type III pantothenate kinase [Candidatus Omnitrophica bacterium]|nr:type III pantothenate kinase [Candidatus Omnitrophota bacterium]